MYRKASFFFPAREGPHTHTHCHKLSYHWRAQVGEGVQQRCAAVCIATDQSSTAQDVDPGLAATLCLQPAAAGTLHWMALGCQPSTSKRLTAAAPQHAACKPWINRVAFCPLVSTSALRRVNLFFATELHVESLTQVLCRLNIKQLNELAVSGSQRLSPIVAAIPHHAVHLCFMQDAATPCGRYPGNLMLTGRERVILDFHSVAGLDP